MRKPLARIARLLIATAIAAPGTLFTPHNASIALSPQDKIVLPLVVGGSGTAPEQSTPNAAGNDPIASLSRAAGGHTQLGTWNATGKLRFISFSAAQAATLSASLSGATMQDKASAFLARHGAALGIRDAARQLVPSKVESDSHGFTHIEYRQVHNGMEVFAGLVKLHFNAAGNLYSVNGNFVSDLKLATAPLGRSASATLAGIAIAAVRDEVAKELPMSPVLSVRAQKSVVYRTNLAQDIPGRDYFVDEIEVVDGAGVRQRVYVDVTSGAVVDRVELIHTALKRKVYEQVFGESGLVWQEGDPQPFVGNTPTQTLNINNILLASGESYNMFRSLFGRLSYDGKDAEMLTVNNDPRINCPNANWNGITTNYCDGVTSDETVAHEWGHAYTEYTHDLIYAYQPGALNEAYSDIWGEVVDINNNRQTDVDALRTDATCTIWSPPAARLTVNTPISIAGQYPMNTASFGPALTAAGISGDVVLVDDGVGTSSNPADADGVILTTMDACTSLTNAAQVAGKIALVVRGGCAFVDKTVNAQAAGAIGVIVMNHSGGGDVAPGMSGSNSAITITTVSVGRSTGLKLAGAQVANTVNVTAALAGGSSGLNNTRWVVGEDDPAFGGAIRDMWNPNCNSHPGRVTDAFYFCGATDSGGVHSNSGVPNHGFTLLVDGGTFNGQTVSGIGFVKAAHIYWRAQSVYQVKNSDFKDHADAIEQSCMDLAQAGTNLNGLSFGDPTGPSGQVVTANDCQQVAKVTQAVELRTPPAQCNFQPMFRQDVPPLCATGTPTHILTETFESGIAAGWAISTFGVFSNALPYQWVLTNTLPPGRTGTAFYAVDRTNPDTVCSNDADDGSRRMSLTSPVFIVPNNIPFTMTKRIAFDHWMFSETGFDGGNIKASVNGGPFNVIAPSAFISNTYNSLLTSAAGGNTNPMAGERAWTGADNNNSQRSNWGQSQINLSAIANPGDTVQLRFDFGTDGCGGADGWYVDNVEALYCYNGEPPTFETATPSVTPTSTNTPTSTRTPTNTPTQTATPTATETPTGTPPTPTHTATPADTATPTNTPVPPTCPTVDEGFESGAFPPAEWLRINKSAPVGPLGWFTTTGSSANFTTPFGIRYAGANFQSTDPGASGTINNWLLTRPLSLTNGDKFTFWTRAQGGFADRLQVRLSTTGTGADVGSGATDVGTFTTLLTDINPSLNLVDYPTVWTQYTITLSGLPANANGRIAFRYFVTDGGGGNNSDRIGVDDVKFSGCAYTPPVVETATPTPTPTNTPTRTPQPTATPYGDACYVMNAVLSGSNEVPPSSSPGEGFGVFNVDTINNRVVYSITHSGVLSESAAHIHGFAPAGANAGVLHHLPPGNDKFGVWYYNEAQEDNILNELTYVNIHNPQHPAGAIRGQIVRISVGNCALLEPVPHLNVTLGGVASGAPPAAEIEYTARLTRTYTAPLARGDAANAAAVSLIAPIPPGTTYIAGSAVPAPAVVLPGNAGLVWNVPYAQAGSGFVARYRVAVGATVTEVSNTVTGLDGTDVATSNTVVHNFALPTATPTAVPPTATPTATSTRSPEQRPDLTLRKDARDHRVRPGERVVFELKYENDSAVDVTGVVIREVVPVNSKFDAAGSTTGWSCADGAVAGTLCELSIGALAGEAEGTALFAVKAVNAPIWPRVIVNLARILDDGTHGADRRPHNNYAFDIVAIRNSGGGGLTRGTETTTWTWEGADVTVTSNDGVNYGVGVAAEGEHLGTRAVETDLLIYLPAVAR